MMYRMTENRNSSDQSEAQPWGRLPTYIISGGGDDDDEGGVSGENIQPSGKISLVKELV